MTEDTYYKTLRNITGDVVLTKGEYGFQPVIDDFSNAAYINIVTYNITPFEGSELIGLLRNIPYDVPINIVLNIPKKSIGTPYASKQVYWYLRTLERHKFNDLNIYFNFSNHAKLVMTNNIAYIGSQNFSDASSDKMELGIVIHSRNEVEKINLNVFAGVMASSIRYATSDYVLRIEEIQKIMKGVLENLRENIFTIVGDPPYTPEIEIFSIDNTYFPQGEWDRFKDLDEELYNIIDEISSEYEQVFNNTEAEKLKVELQNRMNTFISQVDVFVNYLSSWDRKVFDRFYEIDNGDTDSTMEIVMDELHDEKEDKFDHLNGDQLLKQFDQIKPVIENILKLVDEIKYEMLKNTVYENQSLIQ